jgi:hypothetical protein
MIWEATNLLLLIPAVIGLVMLTRWFQGRPVLTDRDGSVCWSVRTKVSRFGKPNHPTRKERLALAAI